MLTKIKNIFNDSEQNHQILQPYKIKFYKDDKYNSQVTHIGYICIVIVLLFIIFWYIFYSEPIKIYRVSKIDPIQYKL